LPCGPSPDGAGAQSQGENRPAADSFPSPSCPAGRRSPSGEERRPARIGAGRAVPAPGRSPGFPGPGRSRARLGRGAAFRSRRSTWTPDSGSMAARRAARPAGLGPVLAGPVPGSPESPTGPPGVPRRRGTSHPRHPGRGSPDLAERASSTQASGGATLRRCRGAPVRWTAPAVRSLRTNNSARPTTLCARPTPASPSRPPAPPLGTPFEEPPRARRAGPRRAPPRSRDATRDPSRPPWAEGVLRGRGPSGAALRGP
jgi:hypothetical protein